MDNSKTDACSYLLVCLLQRLDDNQAGFITELKDGVQADMNSALSNSNTSEAAKNVFPEALKILEQATR